MPLPCKFCPTPMLWVTLIPCNVIRKDDPPEGEPTITSEEHAHLGEGALKVLFFLHSKLWLFFSYNLHRVGLI